MDIGDRDDAESEGPKGEPKAFAGERLSFTLDRPSSDCTDTCLMTTFFAEAEDKG